MQLLVYFVGRSCDEPFNSRRVVKIMFKGTFGSVRKEPRLELNVKVEFFRLKGEHVLFKFSAVD